MAKAIEREVIGLIGLGLVGTALSEHLITGGYEVVGYDIDPERCQALVERGGCVLNCPASIAENADSIFLSLLTTDDVCKVIEGEGGILQASSPPRIIIDTTTGTPDETMALAERLQKQGVQYLDATISGSSQQIRDREALFMVGGVDQAYVDCGDLFAAVSNKFMRVGPSGSGSKAKLASNHILGLNRLVLAEGLVFAEQLGLELKPFLQLLKQSPAYSVAMDVKGDKMIEGDFSPQARIRQHNKDLAIILKCAKTAGQDLPLAQLHHDILEKLIANGDGDLDCSAVIKAFRQLRSK